MKQTKGKNIVLLSTDSRESQLKHAGYAAAARVYGLQVRAAPDRNTLGIIPTSDYKALEAAWMAQYHGIPGPDPIAVNVAFHKSLAYQFFRNRKMPALRWFFPMNEKDLREDFGGRIFVKPEYGSGSYCPYPWGYREFSSVAAFHRYLKKHGWVEQFLRHQAEPPHWSGRFLAMEYVEGPLYSVGAVLGDEAMGVFVRKEARVPRGLDMNPDRITFGVVGGPMPAIDTAIRALQEFGLRRSCVFMQCVVRNGRPYPIDINLRPGNAIAKLSAVLGLPLYEEILGCMLGLKPAFEFQLPQRYAQLHRWMLPLEPGRAKVHFPPQAVPLVDEYFYDPQKPYDRSYARPLFALLGASRARLDREAAQVIAATSIEPLTPA